MTLYAVKRTEVWKPTTRPSIFDSEDEDYTTFATFLAATVWPQHRSAFMWRSSGETCIVLFEDEGAAVAIILALDEGHFVPLNAQSRISYDVVTFAENHGRGLLYPTIVRGR